MRIIVALLIFLGSIITYFQSVTIYIIYQLKGEIEYRHFWKSFEWLFKSYETAAYNLVVKSFIYMLPILLIGIILTYLVMNKGKSKTNKTLHGSARWATLEDMKKMGLLSDDGVIVGGFEQKRFLRKPKKYTLIHNGPEHILTYAPTRSGKGVGLIVPSLVNWKHSMVATDIKGELWAMTAGYRKKGLNNKVLKFEPAVKDSVKWNPLLEIRKGQPEEVSDAQSIALLIVDPMGKGLDDHWVKTAYSLLTGCILYLINDEEKQKKGEISLSYLDRMLSDPTLPLPKLWAAMTKSNNQIAKQVGQDMLDKPENEAGSIVSTAKSELALYRDPIVANNTNTSDFFVHDIMNSDQPISLYVVVQPSDQTRISPLFRLLINMLIRKNVSEFRFYQSDNFKDYSILQKILRFIQGKDIKKYNAIRGSGNYKHRMLLMLDEFASIGKMDEVQKALAYCAGYGIKAYLIVQDLAQLQDKYGKNESITSNCHIQNAYAPNKFETAQYLSNATGETTIIDENISISSSGGLFSKKSFSKSYQHTKRNLLTPDECMRLRGADKNSKGEITRAGDMLVFVAGYPAIKGVQTLYFQDPVYSYRASIAAPETSDQINTTDKLKPSCLENKKEQMDDIKAKKDDIIKEDEEIEDEINELESNNN